MDRDSKKPSTTSSTFQFVLFVSCLVCVEDLVTEGTCNWICNAESEDMNSTELVRMISQGRMIKLEFRYNEQVDKMCANKTLHAYEKTTSTTVCLKKMSTASSGAIEFLSQTLLEEIYKGQILFGSYKHINVSCIYKSLKRSATNHSSRVSFHTPQSIVYYVEQFANYSNENDKFLTFVTIRKQIRVSVDVSGNSLDVSANHKELTVSDTWLVAFVVMCLGIVLYSPVILLQFRPSEVMIQPTRKKQEHEYLPPPVQAEEQEDSVRTLQFGIPRNDDSPFTEHLSEEAFTRESKHSELVPLPHKKIRPHDNNHSGVVPDIKISWMVPNSIENDSTDATPARVESKAGGPGTPPEALMFGKSHGLKVAFVGWRDEGVSVSRKGTAITAVPNENAFQESRSTNTNSDLGGNSVLLNITKHSRTEETQQIFSQGTDGKLVRMIIVGGPSPVGFGSQIIGNNFFANSSHSHWVKAAAKFVLITLCPVLLLVSFVDVSLLLIKFNSPIARHFPDYSLTGSVFSVTRIVMGILLLISYSFRSFWASRLISSRIWKPCFVHSRHVVVFSRLKCLVYPCSECKNSPPECPIQLDVPDSIAHNIKTLPDAFIKHWSFLSQRAFEYIQTSEIVCFMKVVLFVKLLGILFFFTILNFPMDVFLSSPLVCLCQARMWVLRERFKDQFRGSMHVFLIVEFLLICVFLCWLTYYFTCDAIVVVTATMSFLSLLRHNFTKELLPHVIIVILSYHYCWSCYTSFKAPYCRLVEKLFRSYKKKFNEQEKKEGPNKLISYEQAHHPKLIPRELFKYTCEHKLIGMPIRLNVGKLVLKLGLTLLLFILIFPVLPTPSSESAPIVTTLLAVPYYMINNYINGAATSELSDENVDQAVEDFIEKKK